MARQNLEQRVTTLESQLGELTSEVRSAQLGKTKDWRRTIGAFTNDDGMQRILQDAMRLREADRKKTRSKKTARCKKA